MGRINVTIRIFAGTLVPNLCTSAASLDYGAAARANVNIDNLAEGQISNGARASFDY